MKIDINDIVKEYEDFKRYLENQQEIILELEAALKGISELEDFTGKTADAVKEYCSIAHLEVINIIKMILIDINTKINLMIEDFSSAVDSNKNAIIDTEYINDINSDLTGIADSFEYASSIMASIVSQALSHVSTSKFDYSSLIKGGYEDSILKGKKVINSVESFNNNHINDTANINDAVGNITVLIENMMNITAPTEVNFDVAGFKSSYCYNQLSTYQLEMINEVAEATDSTIHEVLGILGNAGVALSIVLGAIDNTLKIQDAISLNSIKATVDVVQNGGEYFLKLNINETNLPVIRETLKELGLQNLSRSNINDMIRDGLKVINSDGKIVNSKIVKQLESTSGFKDTFNEIITNSNLNGTFLTKTMKVVEVGGTILTIYSNGYDNIYNPDTGKWEVTAENVINTTTDVGVELGLDIGLTKFGACIGGFAGPLGAAIGAGVGFTVSQLGQLIEFGEPPNTVFDYIKNAVKDGTSEIGSVFSKIFR